MDGHIGRDQTAAEMIGRVKSFGLRKFDPLPPPERITEQDLSIVCWMAVVPA